MQIDSAGLQKFLTEVRSRYGLVFDRSRFDELSELIRERAVALRASTLDAYLDYLRSSEQEWKEVANRLTVPETYFFRVQEQFDALVHDALPNRIEARKREKTLRIASLGCATGEEPYSIAIVLRRDFPQLASWNIDIVGFDVSQKALDRAERGMFSKWSLRATPEQVRATYFRSTSRGFELDASIRKMVRFEPRNVLNICDEPEGSFDIVFFRNVMIYFSPESMRAAVACVARLMAPGGYFFIGTAESLRGITKDFSLCHSHEAFYYRREDGDGKPAPRPAQSPAARPMKTEVWETPFVSEPEQSPPQQVRSSPLPLSWMEEIRSSSERITQITSSGPAPERRRSPARGAALSAAMAMFAAEKYSLALKELDELSAEESADADVQVLRAVLLSNAGDIQRARTAALAALGHDHLNAGAHYVLAVCDEQEGNHAAALEHDVMSAYLDPSFAMPYVHAATIHRRQKHHDAACEKIEKALSLLPGENAARILMFGGGFSREALQSYCERELARCRGEQ